MATVHDVAAILLERLGPITAMKLEKLVYYCQCWHLARYGSLLFNERIEAWRQGPIIPALYQRHRGKYTVSSWPYGESANLNAAERNSVGWVVQHYGHFSPIQLSRMTHNELPWRLARGTLPDHERSTEKIRPEVIRNYYARQRADAETATTQATASAALEGIEFDDEWQERLRDVATGVVTADEAVAEEIYRANRV